MSATVASPARKRKVRSARGPKYQKLLADGVLAKIANGDLSYPEAAAKLDMNKGTLHHYVSTFKHDLELAAVPTPENESDLFTDLAKFTEAFFPELDVPDFHREWIEAIHKNAQECGQLLLLAPQRHGKSEMLIRYCVMRICANPDISILWVSKTASLAEKMVGHVRSILEHHPMLADAVLGQGRSFKPGRTSGLSWTDKEFTVANRTRVRKTPTMVAIGTGGTIVGLDADEMILDDPQDHIRCQSPTQREKDKEWFFTDFASRKMEQTALSFIMSRQHMEDLPGLVMRDHAEDWEILTYQAHDSSCVLPEKVKGPGPTGKVANPAHDEAGCVLWPKFRSYKWLMGRRRQDEAHFERNYQNNPRTDATTYITAEDIDNLRDRTRRVGDIPSGCRLIAGIDPAEAKPVAAVLWGYDGLHRHVIDAVEAPASVVGLRQILTLWPARYGCRTFAFEKNIAQSWLLDEEVRRLIQSQRLNLKQFYTSRVNKNSNAIGPISMFQRMRTSPPEITLPGAPGEGQERIDRLVRSWLTFDPDWASSKHADDDLTMASWFPQITMDEWNRPQKREMSLQYDAIGGL